MCEAAHITKPANWRQFVMDLGELDPDAVEAVFIRHGAEAITLSDAGDDPQLEPRPGETPLWRRSRITGLFAGSADLEALRCELHALPGLDEPPACEIVSLEDRPWEREWLKHFGPMAFGDGLWVCPGDMQAPHDDAVVVRLDPGLAFGTGTHATTALCLEWLDGLDIEDRTVLDFGCGSGVLAIAALKLGAASALATDIDPQALVATRENAVRNGVAGRLDIVADESDIHGCFDIVLANILAGPLIDLAAALSNRVASGCLLALSGILSEQVEAVLDAYAPEIVFDEPVFREQDGQTWARLTGRKVQG